MNLRNVSIIHRSIAIFHFTSFHPASNEVPSHGSVCVRPARGLWTATPPHNLEGLSHHFYWSVEEEEHQTASAASKQPPADLPSIFSESEVRLTPFPSLLSSFPLCRQIQLLNDRRVRTPVRPRPSSGRGWRRRSRCSLSQ